MTDQQRQRLSALLDGEGTGDDQHQAISDAIATLALSACWERYAIIGRVMRGEPVATDVRSIATRVAAVIDAEPPLATATPAGGRRGRWWSRARRRPARARPPAAARPLIGVALTAGVALLAVVAGPRLWLADAPGTPELAAGGGNAMIERWRSADEDLLPVANPRNGPRLNELLVSHQERSTSRGLTGFMPYATLVGYGGAR